MKLLHRLLKFLTTWVYHSIEKHLMLIHIR
nr:MAG TPA: hypothetical protein [Caudoviricetes sp.]